MATAGAQRVPIALSEVLYLVFWLVIVSLLDLPLFLYILLLIRAQRCIYCATGHASDIGLGHYTVLDDGVANPNRLLLEGDLRAWGYGCIARHGRSVLTLRLIIEESLLD